MDNFTREETLSEATCWFNTHAGTYARLLERTEDNIEKAFWVFADLGLGCHPEDVEKANYQVFVNAFKSSSIVSAISPKQLVEGAEEFNEIVELIY